MAESKEPYDNEYEDYLLNRDDDYEPEEYRCACSKCFCMQTLDTIGVCSFCQDNAHQG